MPWVTRYYVASSRKSSMWNFHTSSSEDELDEPEEAQKVKAPKVKAPKVKAPKVKALSKEELKKINQALKN